MSRQYEMSVLKPLLTAVALLTTSCVTEAPSVDSQSDLTFTSQVHSMPMTSGATHVDNSEKSFAAVSGAHLTYYGGKVVQHAAVVEVLYGAGTYLPQLTASGAGSLSAFYGQAM